MEQNRKNVKQSTTRKTQHEKLMAALAKKPTAAYLQSQGVSPQKTTTQHLAEAEKQKIIKERLVKNAKNRKRFSNRPISIMRNDELDAESYMDAPTAIGGNSIELKTPKWFRSTEKVDVSVIVPLFKSDTVILDMIKSWPLDNGNLKVEIIFVDDLCPKNSKEVVLKAWNMRKSQIKSPIGKIVYNTKNKGYGGACNTGAEYATGDYLIFLNADTQVTPNWIQPMIDLFKDSMVGLVGNMHLKEGGAHNGTIDSAGSEWRWEDMSFVHIARHSYRKAGIALPFKVDTAPNDVLQIAEREMVTGCCFAIPTKLFNYIGGFNPNYKIGYWEDSEICLNVRELGYKILFQPNSVIYHKLGHTSSGGHKYFKHNRNYFMNKWVLSHRLDPLLLSGARSETTDPVNKILLKRTNAHGDALVATAVCKALKEKYPQVKILFSTLTPEVICSNPYIDEFVEIRNINGTKFDVFYNLDYCYEWRPRVNILDTYAEAVGVKSKNCQILMKPQTNDAIHLPENFIVVHAGKTDWVGRDWPHENFVEIAQRLMDAGEKVVSIGRYTEGNIPCTLDVRNKTNIAQLAWVMSKAKAFIGIDSFPMHVAQAFDVPGISFFGSILPESRIYSKKMKGITAENLACLGCHHRKPVPSTVTKVCETGTLDCIRTVSTNNMWFKILDLLNEVNNGHFSLLG